MRRLPPKAGTKFRGGSCDRICGGNGLKRPKRARKKSGQNAKKNSPKRLTKSGYVL